MYDYHFCNSFQPMYMNHSTAMICVDIHNQSVCILDIGWSGVGGGLVPSCISVQFAQIDKKTHTECSIKYLTVIEFRFELIMHRFPCVWVSRICIRNNERRNKIIVRFRVSKRNVLMDCNIISLRNETRYDPQVNLNTKHVLFKSIICLSAIPRIFSHFFQN